MLPSNPSDILAFIRRHLLDLDRLDLRATEQLHSGWLETSRALARVGRELAQEVAMRVSADQVVNLQRLREIERYQEYLTASLAEMRKYAGVVSDVTTDGQVEAADIAQRAATDIFVATGGVFHRINPATINGLIGSLANGSPLHEHLLRELPAAAVQGVAQAIIAGAAQGFGPQAIAKMISEQQEMAYSRALTITRTEMLRVYRAVSIGEYEASGIVGGYQRISARDERVCAACLFMDDGTVYPLDYEFPTHPRCRCTVVPVLRGRSTAFPRGRQTGVEWFEAQSDEVQKGILGQRRWAMWNDGLVDLKEFVKIEHSSVWGNILGTTPASAFTVIPPAPTFSYDVSQFGTPSMFDEFVNFYSLVPRQDIEALVQYTRYSYEDINRYLKLSALPREKWTKEQLDWMTLISKDAITSDDIVRYSLTSRPMLAHEILNATQSISAVIDRSNGLVDNTLLWRGERNMTPDKVSAFLASYTQGSTFAPNSYWSTSLQQQIARGFTGPERDAGAEEFMFRILAPEGSPGIFLQPVSVYGAEQEWLFPSDITFRILDIEHAPGVTHVTIEPIFPKGD